MENEIENLKKQIEDLQNKLQQNQPTSSEHHEPINTEEKDEYTWEAPVRAFKRWSKKQITTALLWAAIPLLVLLYLREYMLLVTAILFIIVAVALVTIPPFKALHRITNKGLRSFTKQYLWEDLGEFWITTKSNSIVLNINTKLVYPANLIYIIPKEHLSGVIKAISAHLKYRELREQQSFISKWTDGLYVPYNDISGLEASNTLE